jgi:hypothetical protein
MSSPFCPARESPGAQKIRYAFAPAMFQDDVALASIFYYFSKI